MPKRGSIKRKKKFGSIISVVGKSTGDYGAFLV
jgi:hypothetical protein